MKRIGFARKERAIALPERTPRPKTAVQKVKEKLDPLTMARIAGVLVEPRKTR